MNLASRQKDIVWEEVVVKRKRRLIWISAERFVFGGILRKQDISFVILLILNYLLQGKPGEDGPTGPPGPEGEKVSAAMWIYRISENIFSSKGNENRINCTRQIFSNELSGKNEMGKYV